MILSDLPSPAEASSQIKNCARASRRRETGNHPRLREGMLFGIMLKMVRLAGHDPAASSFPSLRSSN
jgi:hypothetical protein